MAPETRGGVGARPTVTLLSALMSVWTYAASLGAGRRTCELLEG